VGLPNNFFPQRGPRDSSRCRKEAKGEGGDIRKSPVGENTEGGTRGLEKPGEGDSA